MPLWGGYTQVRSSGGDETVAYAASSAGVFRRNDATGVWRQISDGLPDGFARLVGVDAARPKRLFVQITDPGLASLGVFETGDAGETWHPARLPGDAAASFVYEVACDGRDPERLVAATSFGLFATVDGGDAWTELGGSALRGASMVAIDPEAPGRVLVSTLDRTWRSEDGGATFEPVLEAFAMSRFVFDPERSRTLYGVNGSLWRSTDAGAHWQRLAPPTDGREALSVELGDGGRLLVGTRRGVVFSDDQGATWHRAGEQIAAGSGSPPDAIGSLARFAGGTLAAGPRGAWTSNDGAAPWRAASTGIAGQSLDALAALPAGGIAGLASQGDFFAAAERGFRFRRLIRDPFVLPTPGLTSVSASSPSVLYAGWPGVGLFRSRDGGRSWEKLDTPAAWSLSSVAIDPRDSDVVYLGAREVTPRDGFGHCFALKSVDGGASWNCLTGIDQLDQVVIDPAHASALLARQYGNLWKSSDAGNTWTPLPARGLPRGSGAGSAETSVTRFAVDPSNGRRLWVGTDDGRVWRSDDGGDSFRRRDIGLPLGYASQIEVDPRRSARVVIALSMLSGAGGGAARPLGLYASDDSGRSWHALNDGLPSGVPVTALAADRRIAGRFWAGVEGHGLFRIDLALP